MKDSLVIEAYKELKLKFPGITPRDTEVRREVIKSIDAKAYDIIYGINKNDIKVEDIAKILTNNNLIFYCTSEGVFYNNPQRPIF